MLARFKTGVRVAALLAFFLIPMAVGFAQTAQHTPSGGIVPCGAVSGFTSYFRASECGLCDVVPLIQNIINFLIALAVPISIGLFAWAGIMYFTAGGSPTQIERAHKIFKSVLIGFAIALGGWLIVQTLLNALVNQNFFTSGSWNQLTCIDKRERQSSVSNLFKFLGGPVGTGVDIPRDASGRPAVLSSSADCAPDAIKAAASQGGYELTDAQAKTFSCIAGPESGCRNNAPQAKMRDGTPTTATGVFQVVFGYNDTCHNLNLPVCAQAARESGTGYTVSGNLNCSTAFLNGRPKAGMESLANACKAAAQNFTCNAAAAACLLKVRPSFSDWTSDPDSSKQKACINEFNK